MDAILAPYAPVSKSTQITEALSDARFLTDAGRISEAIEVLTAVEASEDPNVFFCLGYAYNRRREAGDRAKAELYLKRAANRGHKKAINMVARRNMNRWIGTSGRIRDVRTVILDSAKAFLPWDVLNEVDLRSCPNEILSAALKPTLESRAAGGDVLAQMVLAVVILSEKGRSVASTAKAIELLEAAVSDGRIEAVRFLGTAYLEGTLIEKSPVRAAELFHFGTELSCTECRHHLAECYLNGIGVAAHTTIAVALLQENTELGHGSSPYTLGRLLIEGTKVSKDIPRGMEMLRLAASRHCSDAASYLAQFLRRNPKHAQRPHEGNAYAVIAAGNGGQEVESEMAFVQAADLPVLMETVRQLELLHSSSPR